MSIRLALFAVLFAAIAAVALPVLGNPASSFTLLSNLVISMVVAPFASHSTTPFCGLGPPCRFLRGPRRNRRRADAGRPAPPKAARCSSGHQRAATDVGRDVGHHGPVQGPRLARALAHLLPGSSGHGPVSTRQSACAASVIDCDRSSFVSRGADRFGDAEGGGQEGRERRVGGRRCSSRGQLRRGERGRSR